MTAATINDTRCGLLADTIRAERGEWTTERAHALLTSHGHDVDVHTAWGLLLHHAERVRLLTRVGPDAFVLAAEAGTVDSPAGALEGALFGDAW